MTFRRYIIILLTSLSVFLLLPACGSTQPGKNPTTVEGAEAQIAKDRKVKAKAAAKQKKKAEKEFWKRQSKEAKKRIKRSNKAIKKKVKKQRRHPVF